VRNQIPDFNSNIKKSGHGITMSTHYVLVSTGLTLLWLKTPWFWLFTVVLLDNSSQVPDAHHPWALAGVGAHAIYSTVRLALSSQRAAVAGQTVVFVLSAVLVPSVVLVLSAWVV
jgi:hypothetical protein